MPKTSKVSDLDNETTRLNRAMRARIRQRQAEEIESEQIENRRLGRRVALCGAIMALIAYALLGR